MRQNRLLTTQHEHVRAEQAGDQSEAMTQAVMQSLTTQVALLDPQGVIIAVNDAWTRYALENGAASLDRVGVGVNYLAVCRQADGPYTAGAHEALTGIEAVLSGQKALFTLEYPCPSPTIMHWYLLIATQLPAPAGGAIVSHMEITDRRQIEERLRLLETAVIHSNESILITRADLEAPGPTIVYVNPAFTRITGYTPEEVIGKNPRILQGSKTDRAVLDRLRRQCLHGEIFHGEAINYRKDGQEFYLEWSIAPVRDESGVITHFVATQFDATQRKEQEAQLHHQAAELTQRNSELARLNRALEDTNRGVVALYAELDEKVDHLRRADAMKSHFLSNMSHEFRTPLNSILALTRLLLDRLDGDLSSEQEKQVNFIRKAATDLSELVNDLLDLAKIEAGKIEVRPAAFEVSTLFSTLRGMLRPLLVGAPVDLIFEEPVGLPPLYSDESKISQILRNFLSNALKFTERGAVRVSASLCDDGQYVRFAVRDTGIGIAPEHQAQIFAEFVQLENPLQKRNKGTGLGLPLCRRLAELLGGTVGVTSALGVGSTFSVTLPLRYAEAAPPVADAEPAPSPEPSRPVVLVVEDNEELLFVYERYLADTGFQFLAARSVREARCQLERLHPHAILLDILLPDESSWRLLAELKNNPATASIPVLVATTEADQQKGLALGADAYGVKPITREWLLAELAWVAPQDKAPG